MRAEVKSEQDPRNTTRTHESSWTYSSFRGVNQ